MACLAVYWNTRLILEEEPLSDWVASWTCRFFNATQLLSSKMTGRHTTVIQNGVCGWHFLKHEPSQFFSQGKQWTVYIVKMSFQTKIRVLENYMSLSLLALQNFKNCSDDIVGDTIKWNVSTFGRSWKLSKPMFSEWPTHIIKSGMGKRSTQSIRQANETV